MHVKIEYETSRTGESLLKIIDKFLDNTRCKTLIQFQSYLNHFLHLILNFSKTVLLMSNKLWLLIQ